MLIAVYVLLGIIGLALLSYPFMTFLVSKIVFDRTLKKRTPETWGRQCSIPEDEDQVKMFNEGLEWSERFKDRKKDVHIINEGFNLYGEYFDLGFDRAVIIVPGRMESLLYSYYFAKPYQEKGFNVFVFDQRAHGLSDGIYNSLGLNENRDLIAWINFLKKEFGVEKFLIHGCCIGSACALYALTSKNCPDGIMGLVAEGMYEDFYDSYKNHLIELKKPVFPILQEVNMYFKHYNKATMKDGPKNYIEKYNLPLLMIHCKKDTYSLPDKAQNLFLKCPSQNKTLVWFDDGRHSHLRSLDTEKYDNAIKSFIDTL